MRVNLPDFGSIMASCRPEVSTGNCLADGWSEPFLQKSGLAGGRIRAVNQTRPFSSNIGLCTTAWLSQSASSPQYGEGANIGSLLVLGVLGSRTGIFTVPAELLAGCRTGRKSVLFSGAP
jgi:hypothetical protein